MAEFIRRTLSERPDLRLRYVVRDRGGNLLAALRALALPVVSDCSHVMTNLVKQIFKDDTTLSKLCAQVGELRQSLLLTDYAFALPATLRDRDRFGRLFTLVPWMDRIDRYAAGGLDAEMYARLCAGRNRWLDLRLRQVHGLLVLTAKLLKHEGLSQDSYDQWLLQIITFAQTQSKLTVQVKAFIEGMITYFTDHAAAYATDTKLLSCSDIMREHLRPLQKQGGYEDHLSRCTDYRPVQSAPVGSVCANGDVSSQRATA